jgi:WD40 repeat protein
VANPHSGDVSDVAVLPGLMATAGSDHAVRLWYGGQPQRTSGGVPWEVKCAAYSPGGTYLATGSPDGTIRLWNGRTWELLHSWRGHTDSVKHVAFAPGDGVLASSSDDGNVVLWKVPSGEEIRTIASFPPGGPVAFNHDGSLMAARGVGALPIDVAIYDVASGKPTKTLNQRPGGPRGEFAFSRDSRLLAVGANSSTIAIWNAATGTATTTLGPASRDEVTVAVGKRLVIAASWTTVDAWDIASGASVCSLTGHTARIRAVRLSPDETTIASAAEDGTVRLWDIATAAHVKTFRLGPAGAIVEDVQYSPDGRYLVTVNGNGTAYVLRVPSRE